MKDKPYFKKTYRQQPASPPSKQPTSWEPVGQWYHGLVGNEGHYYHQSVILPGVKRLFNLEKTQNASLLDLACGQGILSRTLPAHVTYTGVDISASLIKSAKQESKSRQNEFVVADVSKPLPLKKTDYSHATIILALQNIEGGEKVIQNATKHLQQNGNLLIVLNHPCFRIPRQSSWGIDEQKKIQYRRLDCYQQEMKIPIQMHPGKGESSPSTLSFHHPLSTYSQWLFDAGFHIAKIEEWTSDKVSTGSKAKMENRARDEFPLFMAILAVKQ